MNLSGATLGDLLLAIIPGVLMPLPVISQTDTADTPEVKKGWTFGVLP
ncbi:MAG: hypothetical protein KGY69_12470 [Bacteroidales bacterium]|nr:hypothetical protein [Bacteroidales bacterium]